MEPGKADREEIPLKQFLVPSFWFLVEGMGEEQEEVSDFKFQVPSYRFQVKTNTLGWIDWVVITRTFDSDIFCFNQCIA